MLKIKEGSLTVWHHLIDGVINRGQSGTRFDYMTAGEALAGLWSYGLGCQHPVRTKVSTNIPCFISGFQENGCAKDDHNLIKSSLLVLDYDENVHLTPEEVIRKLEWETILYTTQSDQPAERHYRLLIRLNRPVSKSEWKDLTALVNDRLGGGVHGKALNSFFDCPLKDAQWLGTENKLPLSVDGELGLLGLKDATGTYDSTPETVPIPSPVVGTFAYKIKVQESTDIFLAILQSQALRLVNMREGGRNKTCISVGFAVGAAYERSIKQGCILKDTEVLDTCYSSIGDWSMDDKTEFKRTVKRGFDEGRKNPFEDMSKLMDNAEQKIIVTKRARVNWMKLRQNKRDER